MLVLSRGKEQSVVITVPPSQVPQQVTVMVLEFRGDKTRLGFQADRDVRINRSEIEERIEIEGLIEKIRSPSVCPFAGMAEKTA